MCKCMNGLFNKPRTKLITDILQNVFDVKQFIASNKLTPKLRETEAPKTVNATIFCSNILMNQGCMMRPHKLVGK